MSNALPPAPVERKPETWEHYELWKRVRNAVFATSHHFSTATNVEGLLASDIFTLNAPLSATIEESVVGTLNALRPIWDVTAEYQTFAFVRQAQTFPDVVLRAVDNGDDKLMGIELKSWYLLAKEKHPTYRFTATAAACNPWDLLVVVPWVLSNVLSGTPILFRPFVRSAVYCAEMRNYYWQHIRTSKADKSIKTPSNIQPFPLSRAQISDKATKDSGGNFGRLARYGIMDEYMKMMLAEKVRGVTVDDWVEFFKAHARG